MVRTPTADLQRAVPADPALLAFPGGPEDDLRVCRAALDALATLPG